MIRAKTNQNHPLISKGHIVAWEQFQLPISRELTAAPLTDLPTITILNTEAGIEVHAENFSVSFNRATGQIKQYIYNGIELFIKPVARLKDTLKISPCTSIPASVFRIVILGRSVKGAAVNSRLIGN